MLSISIDGKMAQVFPAINGDRLTA